MAKRNLYGRVADWGSEALGSPIMFLIGCAFVSLWAMLGPVLHFSNTWHLLINTPTTILTFLGLILVQHTQNRDTKDLKAMSKETVHAIPEADNAVADDVVLPDSE